MKQYEVEQKFPVSDFVATEAVLSEIHAQLGDEVEQVDQYFAHPARDFAVTDEALRIRSVGDRNVITYKGPKIDQKTKTRRELELPLAAGEEGARGFTELLKLLGFIPVAQVSKRRRLAVVTWHGWEVVVSLDEVQSLGYFVELEIAADESRLDQARRQLASLAERMGLTGGERRSYLELLLGGD